MTDTQTDRQKALNAASGAASKRLKEAHQKEWDQFMVEEATARNQKWEPKPSPEEKAKAEFERLLAEHPHLADSLTSPDTDTPTPTMPEAPPMDPA